MFIICCLLNILIIFFNFLNFQPRNYFKFLLLNSEYILFLDLFVLSNKIWIWSPFDWLALRFMSRMWHGVWDESLSLNTFYVVVSMNILLREGLYWSHSHFQETCINGNACKENSTDRRWVDILYSYIVCLVQPLIAIFRKIRIDVF